MTSNVLTSGTGKRAGARDTIWIATRILAPGLLLAAAGDLLHLDIAAQLAEWARLGLAQAGVAL